MCHTKNKIDPTPLMEIMNCSQKIGNIKCHTHTWILSEKSEEKRMNNMNPIQIALKKREEKEEEEEQENRKYWNNMHTNKKKTH